MKARQPICYVSFNTVLIYTINAITQQEERDCYAHYQSCTAKMTTFLTSVKPLLTHHGFKKDLLLVLVTCPNAHTNVSGIGHQSEERSDIILYRTILL